MKINFQCGLSVGFLFTSFLMMFLSKGSKFEKSLDKDKLKMYKKVVSERRNIWFLSTVIGVIASYVYHKNFSISDNSKFLACSNTLVFFLVQYFVYTLHPKKNWVLNNLEKKEDVSNWLKMYRKMKYKWHIGIIMGLIGYVMFNYFIINEIKKN
jgi:hypothetical protein